MKLDKPNQKKEIISGVIISIGNELLSSGRINTTAPAISKSLEKLGFQMTIITLNDDEETLINFLNNEIALKASIIITCGGLGSTSDDKTLEAVAQAYKRKVEVSEEHLKYLASLKKKIYFKNKNSEANAALAEVFFKQARYPAGFKIKKNRWGTAPFLYEYDEQKNTLVSLLPGVPSECLGLFENEVLPLAKKIIEKVFKKSKFIVPLKVLGMSEIEVEKEINQVHQVEQKGGEVEIAYLPSGGELMVELKGYDELHLKSLRKKIKNHFHKHYPNTVVYPSGKSLVEVLHALFIKKKMKIGFVESLTGGLLSTWFVELPRASNYLKGSLVLYSNEEKVRVGGVKKNHLEEHGPVSSVVVETLAHNFLIKGGLDLALAISGVAGPKPTYQSVNHSSDKSLDKPVGLVWIGLAIKKSDRVRVYSKQYNFKGDRNQIRKRSAKQATILLAEELILKE